METYDLNLGASFCVRSASDIAAEWWTLPEVPGVYGLLLRHESDWREVCAYHSFSQRKPAMIDGFDLVNVGSTTRLNLQKRISHHVFGDSRVSSLRRTVGALFGGAVGIRPYGDPGVCNFRFDDEGEAWLTNFLSDNALFAFRHSPEPAVEEMRLIKRHKPPFNIQGLERTRFAKHLLALRREMADEASR